MPGQSLEERGDAADYGCLALYPLIGEKIYGPIGTIGTIGTMVDVFAILGTACGVATSLGLGVLQIREGGQNYDVMGWSREQVTADYCNNTKGTCTFSI